MWRLVSLQLSVIVDTLCVHDRATRCFLTLSWQQVCIFVYMTRLCTHVAQYVCTLQLNVIVATSVAV
jgi:hypothetical protein